MGWVKASPILFHYFEPHARAVVKIYSPFTFFVVILVVVIYKPQTLGRSNGSRRSGEAGLSYFLGLVCLFWGSNSCTLEFWWFWGGP